MRLRREPVEKENVRGLVAAAQGGDVGAFEQLFRLYQARIYNTILQMVRHREDAEDLTQEVFVRAWRHLKKLSAPQAFHSWLTTTAINICRDHARRKPPATESLDEPVELDDEDTVYPQFPDEDADPEEQVLQKEQQRLIQKAVAELPEHHREVIVLHHFQEMDVEEMAKILRCPVGTVKSRLSRAREALRKKLGEVL